MTPQQALPQPSRTAKHMRPGEVGITISVLTYYPDTGVLVLVKSEHFDPASEPERPALPVSFRRGLVRGVSGCSE